jgi:hypothetical protein
MKEPFVISPGELTNKALLINDMQLHSYISSLSDTQKQDLVTGNIANAISSVENSKTSTYDNMIDQLTGADNSITSAAYYISRTQDLATATEDIDKLTLSQLTASSINNGLTKRQKEINEWSNLNKLDTLYFLQVLFISLSLTGFLAFLLSNGSISESLFTFVSYIIGILAVIILLLRWRYTAVARDSRYWHKSRFPKEDVVKTSTGKCKTGWLW